MEVIQQRYKGKWPKTVSYIKKQAIKRYGREDTSMQYHAYLFPKYARIDQGDLDDGNAKVIHGNVSYTFRKYKKNSEEETFRYFSDYMLGEIYFDDIAGMKKVLAVSKIDFNLQGRGIWEGKPVYIIGATSLEDRYNTQVWYDAENLYPVRFIDGRSGNVLDTQYQIKKYGTVWIPVAAKEFVNKRQTGTVDYLNFSFDRNLSEEIFDVDRFGSFHWIQDL